MLKIAEQYSSTWWDRGTHFWHIFGIFDTESPFLSVIKHIKITLKCIKVESFVMP